MKMKICSRGHYKGLELSVSPQTGTCVSGRAEVNVDQLCTKCQHGSLESPEGREMKNVFDSEVRSKTKKRKMNEDELETKTTQPTDRTIKRLVSF